MEQLERYLSLIEYGTEKPAPGKEKIEQASVRVRFGVGGGAIQVEAWFTGGRRFYRGELDLKEFSAREIRDVVEKCWRRIQRREGRKLRAI